MQWEHLHNRKVNSRQTRTHQQISTGRSIRAQCVRNEGLCVEPSLELVGLCPVIRQRWVPDNIGTIHPDSTERIVDAGTDCKRQAVTNVENPIRLPIADHVLSYKTEIFETRNSPRVRQPELMRNIVAA